MLSFYIRLILKSKHFSGKSRKVENTDKCAEDYTEITDDKTENRLFIEEAELARVYYSRDYRKDRKRDTYVVEKRERYRNSRRRW